MKKIRKDILLFNEMILKHSLIEKYTKIKEYFIELYKMS